jgi:branched-chain amino acid transport system ATP-binding protein
MPLLVPTGLARPHFSTCSAETSNRPAARSFSKGRDITHQPVHRTIHYGIGRSFQITNIFPNLTVFENIRLAAQALGRDNFKFWQAASQLSKPMQHGHWKSSRKSA